MFGKTLLVRPGLGFGDTHRRADPPMLGNASPSAPNVDYYAESHVTLASLTLLNHPLLHSVKIRNHMAAEGIHPA